MHPFRRPSPEEWDSFVMEVERLLGEPIFSVERSTDVMTTLMLFHASIQACGEGASPQAFANVLKGRMH